MVDHLVAFHDHWNQSTAREILAAYSAQRHTTEAARIVQLGTDLMFRCGTRSAARALSDAGNPVWVYSFEYKFSGWIDPSSELCESNSMVHTMLSRSGAVSVVLQHGCGVYHGSEVLFVWDNLGIDWGSFWDHVGTIWGYYWDRFGTTFR